MVADLETDRQAQQTVLISLCSLGFQPTLLPVAMLVTLFEQIPFAVEILIMDLRSDGNVQNAFSSRCRPRLHLILDRIARWGGGCLRNPPAPTLHRPHAPRAPGGAEREVGPGPACGCEAAITGVRKPCIYPIGLHFTSSSGSCVEGLC